MNHFKQITVVAAVNNHLVLTSNLLHSSLLNQVNVQFIQAEGFSNASQAYNYGIDQSIGDYLIFAHQDVYIPSSWQGCLEKALLQLKDQPWAVLGIIGKTKKNEVVGRTWSTGLNSQVGHKIDKPVPVESIDELLIVVNKKSDIRFDENLPGFHLYGTDIVQTAIKMGYGAYVIDAPVIHNSLPYLKYDKGFVESYRFMRKKWKSILPITTLVTTINRSGWPLWKKLIKQYFKRDNRSFYKRLDDPAAKAKELGYE